MKSIRRNASAALLVSVAVWAAAAARAHAGIAGPAALPPEYGTPVPHAAGDILDYTLHGTMSQSITGRSPYGDRIRQTAAPTQVLGHERIAIKVISAKGLALHRTGTIMATFRGKSSPAQRGSGWTLVSPDGIVSDRKGSTLGGLFLLPLGFLGPQSVDGGGALHVGDRWNAKLGVALFGMTARPMLDFVVTGARDDASARIFSLTATGLAPVKEPVVTNDDVALGYALGESHVTLRCEYDATDLRVVSLQIDVSDRLKIALSHGSDQVSDLEHYLVALDDAMPVREEHDPPASDAAVPGEAGGPTAPPR